jgi:hypothetical protein
MDPEKTILASSFQVVGYEIEEVPAGLFSPVADIFKAREARKAAKEAAAAKLAMATAEGQQKIELNKDEYEVLATQGLAGTWKDEYVTVSVVSILNTIVIGGLASAFGYPQILIGVGTAIKSLSTAGVDVGFIMEATIMAAIGLSIWKKV